jgi:hypothetical protein
VPVRIIRATIGLVLAATLALYLVVETRRVLSWMVVAAFFAAARTVRLNPLTVIVAILLGVELLGVLGALLAIPVAGMIRVIVRDVWDLRRGRLKEEPTVGQERRPAVAPDDGDRAEQEPTATAPPSERRGPSMSPPR